MNIAIVQNSILPAIKYGGTQRVIWYLAKELNNMGHKVTFLAAEGSTCPFAKVIAINPTKDIATQIPHDIDIVHLNSIPSGEFKQPCVITVHGNSPIGKLHPNMIFVSRNHAERFGCNSYVYNGMDWSDYGRVNLDQKRAGFHFLGNAAWRVKNVRGAISTVNKLKGERLTVLGGYRFNFKMGMRFTLSPKISFKGMVNDAQKQKYIERSKGLIFPVTWHEPFGLAITETLYFGAPVFGTLYGSLTELVLPEVGFLTNNQTSLIEHLSSNPEYSPKVCHEYACDNFNSAIMARQYLDKYTEVLNGNPLITNLTPKMDGVTRGLSWNK